MYDYNVYNYNVYIYIGRSFMEVYDYTNENEEFTKDSLIIDTLSNKQLKKLSKYVKIIQMDSEKENMTYWEQWFNASILPILKEFAETTSSILTIERDENITFSFRNKRGFDITESCMLRFVLLICEYIGIDKDGEDTILTLTFSCNKYI